MERGASARRVRGVGWVVLVALLALWPGIACAGWPLAGSARVLLGFGARYAASGDDEVQHHGVDLEANAGDRVLAPGEGHVTFIGSVPAVGGGRVTAITIEGAEGKITLLPIEHATVTRGARVAAGEVVGALAGTGDGSSPQVHLHVGVRRGALYLDPLSVLSPPAVAVNDDPGAQAGAQAPSGVSAGVTVPSAVAASPGAAAGISGARVAPVTPGELAPGVSIAARGRVPSGAGAGDRLARTGAQAATVSRGLAPADAAAATVLGPDGVVVPAGQAAASGPSGADRLGVAAARAVSFARAWAAKSVRAAGLGLLAVMAALGALWPLWRAGERKGRRKVRVSAMQEDVAAVPGR